MAEGDGARRLEIDALETALHEAGLRMTTPRRRLLQAFIGTDGLITAQELYRSLDRAVGEATVYRLLETLCRLGRARRYVLEDGAVRYLYCGGTHHHHAICVDCGRVREIQGCPAPLPETGDFQVLSHELDLFGRCGECREDPGQRG